ncbi:MAG: hypothetical protein WCA35_18460 [Kovacikia sp.]
MGFSEKQEYQTSQDLYFQPFQIVCLEHEVSYLYAEVVQTVEKRQVCWVRPLVLIVEPLNDLNGLMESSDRLNRNCYDLRQDSDLLFPLILFRIALDTEMVPLFSFLYGSQRNLNTDLCNPNDTDKIGHQKFRQFIQQVWKAYPELF